MESERNQTMNQTKKSKDYDFIYLKSYKRQNYSSRKQINGYLWWGQGM